MMILKQRTTLELSASFKTTSNSVVTRSQKEACPKRQTKILVMYSKIRKKTTKTYNNNKQTNKQQQTTTATAAAAAAAAATTTTRKTKRQWPRLWPWCLQYSRPFYKGPAVGADPPPHNNMLFSGSFVIVSSRPPPPNNNIGHTPLQTSQTLLFPTL